MFSSVAVLIFGDVDAINTMPNAIVWFFQSSVGTFDFGVFNVTDDAGNVINQVQVLGTVFLVVFLLANMILLLNFVIAILSATFAKYDEYKLGLYYNTLNKMMTDMAWCPRFGSLIVYKPPLPLYVLILPFIPAFVVVGKYWPNKL